MKIFLLVISMLISSSTSYSWFNMDEYSTQEAIEILHSIQTKLGVLGLYKGKKTSQLDENTKKSLENFKKKFDVILSDISYEMVDKIEDAILNYKPTPTKKQKETIEVYERTLEKKLSYDPWFEPQSVELKVSGIHAVIKVAYRKQDEWEQIMKRVDANGKRIYIDLICSHCPEGADVSDKESGVLFNKEDSLFLSLDSYPAFHCVCYQAR